MHTPQKKKPLFPPFLHRFFFLESAFPCCTAPFPLYSLRQCSVLRVSALVQSLGPSRRPGDVARHERVSEGSRFRQVSAFFSRCGCRSFFFLTLGAQFPHRQTDREGRTLSVVEGRGVASASLSPPRFLRSFVHSFPKALFFFLAVVRLKSSAHHIKKKTVHRIVCAALHNGLCGFHRQSRRAGAGASAVADTSARSQLSRSQLYNQSTCFAASHADRRRRRRTDASASSRLA